MEMRNRIVIILSIATLVLGIGYYVSTILAGSEEGKEPIEQKEVNDVIETWTSNDEVVEEVEEVKVESQVEKEFPLDMTEADVQNSIHRMSHAKVLAAEKWSHLEPTQERIDRLLDVVKRNQNILDHSALYIRILERWQANDFSNTVTDHNSIWDLQGGTIGEATRLLTEDEQAAYKEKHF